MILLISLILSHTVLCSIFTDPFSFLSSISLDVELRAIIRVLVNSIYRPALEAFVIQLNYLRSLIILSLVPSLNL